MMVNGDTSKTGQTYKCRDGLIIIKYRIYKCVTLGMSIGMQRKFRPNKHTYGGH